MDADMDTPPAEESGSDRGTLIRRIIFIIAGIGVLACVAILFVVPRLSGGGDDEIPADEMLDVTVTEEPTATATDIPRTATPFPTVPTATASPSPTPLPPTATRDPLSVLSTPPRLPGVSMAEAAAYVEDYGLLCDEPVTLRREVFISCADQRDAGSLLAVTLWGRIPEAVDALEASDSISALTATPSPFFLYLAGMPYTGSDPGGAQVWMLTALTDMLEEGTPRAETVIGGTPMLVWSSGPALILEIGARETRNWVTAVSVPSGGDGSSSSSGASDAAEAAATRSALTTTPRATSTPDESIIGACDCSYDHYECSDFNSEGAAQDCFDWCWSEEGSDVHNLDMDNDLLACEEGDDG